MRESFIGFPTLAAQFPRQIYGRARDFPGFSKDLLATGFNRLVMLGPVHGLVEILAGALLNPVAAVASVSLTARIGTGTVASASLDTDVTDNDGITIDSIGTNTPGFFRLRLWHSTDRRLNCLGVSEGGIRALPVNAATISPYLKSSFASTVTGDGPLEVGITVTAQPTAAFTLDFLRVLEYPDLTTLYG